MLAWNEALLTDIGLDQAGIDGKVSATPKHRKVMAWLMRHPCFVLHSFVDLQAAIKRFLEAHHDDPKPFIWTANPDRIIVGTKHYN